MPAASIASALCNCAMAVEETITTPAPGLGHGKLANTCACCTWLLSFLGYC